MELGPKDSAIKVWLLRRRYRQYGNPPENFPSSRVGAQHCGYQDVIFGSLQASMPVWICKVGYVVVPCQPSIEERVSLVPVRNA